MKRLVILPFLLLTACAGRPESQIVDTSCSWVKPIFISKADKLTDNLEFLQGLSTWATFGRGWKDRVSTVENRAFNMVG